jgi:hypothetical protein
MKNQIFVNNQYEYDYDCVKGKNKKEIHTLYYAAVENWSDELHNKASLIIEDTGDGFSIVTKLNYEHLDYIEADQLLVLLKIINTNPLFNSVYEIGTKKLL